MAGYRLFHRSWEKSCQSSAAKRRQCGGNCQGYEKLEEFEKDFPRTALIVRLDVTDLPSVTEAVRAAIEEGICTREELFITSKMWVQDMESYDMAKQAIDASLEKSGLEYLDLYLLHQAMKDYFSAWRAMEDACSEGKLKAIGVSNFYPHDLL